MPLTMRPEAERSDPLGNDYLVVGEDPTEIPPLGYRVVRVLQGLLVIVLALLCLVYVLNFLDRQLLSILAKPIQDDLGLTDGQLGRLGGLVALEGLDLQPAGRRDGLPVRVVDELRDDPAVRARDDEPRPVGRSRHLAPHAAMPAQACFADGKGAHARFPTFRRTYSPW